MECAAFDGGFERGVVEGIVDGNDVRGGFAGSKYRFYPLNQATQGISLKWEDPVVRRYNGQRAMRAQCNNALGIHGGECPFADHGEGGYNYFARRIC